MSFSSGGSFMGFPSLVYTHGWVLALWIASYMLVPLVGMGLLGKRVNRLARQSGAVTIPDLIKARFRSDSVGMIATLLVLFFMFFYLLAQFKAGSKIMTTLLQDVAIYQSAVNAVGGAIDGLPWIGNAEPDDEADFEELKRAVDMIAELSLLGGGDAEELWPDDDEMMASAFQEDREWRVAL